MHKYSHQKEQKKKTESEELNSPGNPKKRYQLSRGYRISTLLYRRNTIARSAEKTPNVDGQSEWKRIIALATKSGDISNEIIWSSEFGYRWQQHPDSLQVDSNPSSASSACTYLDGHTEEMEREDIRKTGAAGLANEVECTKPSAFKSTTEPSSRKTREDFVICRNDTRKSTQLVRARSATSDCSQMHRNKSTSPITAIGTIFDTQLKTSAKLQREETPECSSSPTKENNQVHVSDCNLNTSKWISGPIFKSAIPTAPEDLERIDGYGSNDTRGPYYYTDDVPQFNYIPSRHPIINNATTTTQPQCSKEKNCLN